MPTVQILLIFCNGKPYLYCVMSREGSCFHTSKDVQCLYFRYSQAGTPVVKVASSYNAEARTFSLKFRFYSYRTISTLNRLLNLLLIH